MFSSWETMIRSTGTPRRAARSARYRGLAGAATIASMSSSLNRDSRRHSSTGPDRRCRESFVDRVRRGEAQNIAPVDETDCGIEVFAFIGNIRPMNPFETVVVVGPVAQQCRPCR